MIFCGRLGKAQHAPAEPPGGAMIDYDQHLAGIIRPVSPPRELEGVYTDDQYERMVSIIKREGPWPTITSIHFETVEELIATTTGVVPDNLTLTLDDVATARF